MDLPVGPNMTQIHVSVGRPGYRFSTAEYTPSADMLMKRAEESQPLKIFQFIIGEFEFAFPHLLMNQISLRALLFAGI